jgi:hypothetical protein
MYKNRVLTIKNIVIPTQVLTANEKIYLYVFLLKNAATKNATQQIKNYKISY